MTKATRHKENSVQPNPGTYALLLSSATEAVVRIGRLGNLRLRPGYYVYVGSALGPGGVRARLAHHMRPAERPHWHIDYLRKKTTVEAVWFRYSRKSVECGWAKRFAKMSGASVPIIGFGSSDCHCGSHLFYFAQTFSRHRDDSAICSLKPTTSSARKRSQHWGSSLQNRITGRRSCTTKAGWQCAILTRLPMALILSGGGAEPIGAPWRSIADTNRQTSEAALVPHRAEQRE